MIDAGRYKAKATDAKLAYTAGGREQVVLKFKTECGHFLTYYGSFSDKAYRFTFGALEACGWIGDDITDLSGVTNNEVSLVVELEPDNNGTMRPKVRWVNRPTSPNVEVKKPLTPAQAEVFADKVRAMRLSMQESGAATGGATLDDADIPF